MLGVRSRATESLSPPMNVPPWKMTVTWVGPDACVVFDEDELVEDVLELDVDDELLELEVDPSTEVAVPSPIPAVTTPAAPHSAAMLSSPATVPVPVPATAAIAEGMTAVDTAVIAVAAGMKA